MSSSEKNSVPDIDPSTYPVHTTATASLAFECCVACGNIASNHYFRHPYIGVTVHRYTKTCFELDAYRYPEQKATRCGFSQCTGEPCLHETVCLPHKYDPVPYTYRLIKFVVPTGTVCNRLGCSQTVENHQTVQTHAFTTDVVVRNRQKYDVVRVLHPEDEDIPVVWEERKKESTTETERKTTTVS